MIIMNLSVPLMLTTSTARSNIFDLCEHSYPSLHLYLTMLFISDFKSVLLRGNLVGAEVKKSVSKKESLVGLSEESNHSKTAVNNFRFLQPHNTLLVLVFQHTASPSKISGGCVTGIMLVPVGKLNNSNSEKGLDV
mmetsp:Transcript_28508/g.41881  ORF Transcript_28508/g.41881 Transcript_28508/m.41881 type:complete len:136 (-) Transcript_28508:338-745(-)